VAYKNIREEKMKRCFVFVFCLLVTVLLVSCGKKGPDGGVSRHSEVVSNADGSGGSSSPDSGQPTDAKPARTNNGDGASGSKATTVYQLVDSNMFVDLRDGEKIFVSEINYLEGGGKVNLVLCRDGGTPQKVNVVLISAIYDSDNSADIRSKVHLLGNIQGGKNVYVVSATKDKDTSKFLLFFYGDNIHCIENSQCANSQSCIVCGLHNTYRKKGDKLSIKITSGGCVLHEA
jgi:hypothetical protein